MMDDIGKIVKEALEAALHKRGHVNMLIAGRTGVGKSTLINSIFRAEWPLRGKGGP